MGIIAVIAASVTFLGVAAIIYQLANANSSSEIGSVVGGFTSLGTLMFTGQPAATTTKKAAAKK